MSIVSQVCGLPIEKIVGKDRTRRIVIARQLYCYILREHFWYGLVEIGKSINRDHTTIIHSHRLVKNLLEIGDPQMVEPYEAIMGKIKEESKSEVKIKILLSDLTNPNLIIRDIISRYNCSIEIIGEHSTNY